MVEAPCYKSEGRGFDSLKYFIEIILPAALWLWFESSSVTNEYQKYFLGVKGGRCVRLALTPSCAYCDERWKSQPPETLRSCPDLARIALLFYLLSCLHLFIHLLYSFILPLFLSIFVHPFFCTFHLSVSSAYFILLPFSFIHTHTHSLSLSLSFYFYLYFLSCYYRYISLCY